MPEARLQRTREAYARKPQIWEADWRPDLQVYRYPPDDGLNPAVVGVVLAVIVFAVLAIWGVL